MYQDLLYGYMLHQCLYVVVKLGIPDCLESDEKSIAELAILTDSQPDALYRVMRCLSQYDIFNEHDNKIFSQTDISKKLLTNIEISSRDYLLLCSEILFNASTCLLESIKTGKVAFDCYYGMNFWDYLQTNPDKSILFNNAMEKGFGDSTPAIFAAYDFSPFKFIIDVGGGNGQLVLNILKNNPTAKGLIFDLKQLEESAVNNIKLQQLSDRCTFQHGDFFKNIPHHGDAYLLRVILHDWNDDKALSILKKCRETMSLGSRLIIIERIICDDENKNSTYLGDINMLITIGGKERTEDEFKKLFNEAGFNLNKLTLTKSAFSILECEPV